MCNQQKQQLVTAGSSGVRHAQCHAQRQRPTAAVPCAMRNGTSGSKDVQRSDLSLADVAGIRFGCQLQQDRMVTTLLLRLDLGELLLQVGTHQRRTGALEVDEGLARQELADSKKLAAQCATVRCVTVCMRMFMCKAFLCKGGGADAGQRRTLKIFAHTP